MKHVHPSFCRNCLASCPILVTVEDGRAVKVTGDPEAPAYDGYTCPKGRDLPLQHNAPDRLLHCMARTPDGFARKESSSLIETVARRIERLVSRHGPRAVAVYYGTGNVTNPAGSAMARAWTSALGTDLIFSAMAIDKPAANTSIALHGHWHAGAQAFETADTWMIVGANPVIAKSNGAPVNNPGQRLKEAVDRGLKLIVVDPRRTETARRAHVHLQLRPGEDPTLLAGLIHIILAERLHDTAFVTENAEGFEVLARAVASYTPDHVAARTGVAVTDLLAAARTFGRGRRGGVICSTGSSFSTRSNLTFYLGLCLNTLCGRWTRAGEPAPYPNVLLPAFQPKAQPYAPYPVFGKGRLRAHSLRESAAGMPTAGLADEILLGGNDGIKALICMGGNPMLSWPDQRRTEAALKSLDLLVVLDWRMTATARLAHYVVPPPLSLETAGSTSRVEALKYVGAARGFSIPWAQYTRKIVEPPEGSDLVEDAAFFFRLAQHMLLPLVWTNAAGYRQHVESPPATFPLDMSRMPTNEELVELTCRGSRIPLDEVKRHPHGHLFTQAATIVAPRDPACTARLQLADPMMMDELERLRHEQPGPEGQGPFKYLLTSRRVNKVMNSVGHHVARGLEGGGTTPAFLHPDDLTAEGLAEGEAIVVQSRHGEIEARVQADDTVRPGTIGVVHGFGDLPRPGSVENAPAALGLSVTRLTAMEEIDPMSGIPRLSGIPVSVRRID